MFDSYRHFRDTPKYHKLVGEGFLIVEFKCPIEEEVFRSWSECHYITYVISGRKKWITPQEEWLLHSGESVFVQKGAYVNQQYFEEDFCVLMFFLTDHFIRTFVKNDIGFSQQSGSGPFIQKPIYQIEVTNSLTNLYSSVFDYLNQAPDIPVKMVELKFRELLLNIFSNSTNQELINFIVKMALTGQTPLEKVMEDNYLYNLTIEEFSRLCGRSVSSFKRDFQAQFHMPPRKWLYQKRLDHAKSLLINSEQPVQQICYEVGFENPSHFNRKFKECFKLTPLEYRKSKSLSAVRAGN